MNNPFLYTLKLRFLYIAIWIITIIVQTALVSYYFEFPNGQSALLGIFDSCACNILQAVCILCLWHPVRYYKNRMNVPLFLLFHLTLLLISGTIWIGLGYCLTQYLILSNNFLYTSFFVSILPIRMLFGLFMYVIFVLIYYLFLNRNELKIQKQKLEEKINANATAPVEKLNRIIVKKNSEFHCINLNQIRYIEANGDYVMIYTDSNRYLKDQTMKYWETHLPADYFVRIHRSFIVN